jgi:hypothetical protein
MVRGTFLCNGSASRSRWAISLCFASTILLSIEATHPGTCAWLGLDADQSFALSSIFATLSGFVATYLLTEILTTLYLVK